VKLKSLFEEFKDGIKFEGKYYQIFKNPKGNDLKDIKGNYFRGVVLNNGNLFVIDSDEVIHNTIIQVLKKVKLIRGSENGKDWIHNFDKLNDFLCVASQDMRNWHLSESYTDKVLKNENIKSKLEGYEKKMKANGFSLKYEKLKDPNWVEKINKRLGR